MINIFSCISFRLKFLVDWVKVRSHQQTIKTAIAIPACDRFCKSSSVDYFINQP
ncbi:hypothetical protein [Anabaena sp. CS-542/02]|uniref:hypothetical protein n=1 Tax=Anabaena sp. CS-542/02 TaxID=3021719 RepID=UPI002330B971|nr:hypothetical protein [Anabaena sp. CS-542/02]MDB9445432.1 hypothetical protein [Anabaena sp. CS-542/02]